MSHILPTVHPCFPLTIYHQQRPPLLLAARPDLVALAYYDHTHDLLLIVYVDDMKLVGSQAALAAAWDRLGKHIKLEVPKGSVPDVTHTFLGCEHKRVDRVVQAGSGQRVLRCMEYDMTASMTKTITKYQEAVYKITGLRPRVNGKATPFLPEDTTRATEGSL